MYTFTHISIRIRSHALYVRMKRRKKKYKHQSGHEQQQQPRMKKKIISNNIHKFIGFVRHTDTLTDIEAEAHEIDFSYEFISSRTLTDGNCACIFEKRDKQVQTYFTSRLQNAGTIAYDTKGRAFCLIHIHFFHNINVLCLVCTPVCMRVLFVFPFFFFF